jgi:hypothetical protein
MRRKSKLGWVLVSQDPAGGQVYFPERYALNRPLSGEEGRQNRRHYFSPVKRVYVTGFSRFQGECEEVLIRIFGPGNFRICGAPVGDWVEVVYVGSCDYNTYPMFSAPLEPGWIAMVRPRSRPARTGEPAAFIEWAVWRGPAPPWQSRRARRLAEWPVRHTLHLTVRAEPASLLLTPRLASDDAEEDEQAAEDSAP